MEFLGSWDKRYAVVNPETPALLVMVSPWFKKKNWIERRYRTLILRCYLRPLLLSITSTKAEIQYDRVVSQWEKGKDKDTMRQGEISSNCRVT